MKIDRTIGLRIALGALMIILFGISAANFYRFAGSPTDENVFIDAPSNIYVFRNFAARITYSEKAQRYATTREDSVRCGDLVLRINEQKIRNGDSVAGFLKAIAPQDTVKLFMSRPKWDAWYIAKLPRNLLPDTFFYEIPRTAQVTQIAENGASDRAGMKVGDQIVRINGRAFASAFEADAILTSGQVGKSIAYDILRDHRLLTLPVTLAKFALPFPILLIYIGGIIYILIGSFLVVRRTDKLAARLIGMAFFLMGLSFTVFAGRGSQAVDPFGQFVTSIRWTAMIFGFALLAHGRYYFPVEQPMIVSRKWPVWGLYTIATGFWIYSFFPFNFNVLFISGAAILIYQLILRIMYRKERTSDYKALSRIISWTALGACSVCMAIVFWPNQDNNTNQDGNIGVIVFILTFVPFSYLYTIGRYHLMDIDFRVRRNIQYVLASMAWNGAILLITVRIIIWIAGTDLGLPNIRLTGTSIEISDNPVSSVERLFLEKTFMLLVGLVLAIGFVKLRRMGQNIINLIFNRAGHDYQRAASELAEVMSTNLNMVDLGHGIVEKLSKMMQLKMSGIYFYRDERSCCCREVMGFSQEQWSSVCAAVERPLMKAIRINQSTAPINVDFLPDEMKSVLRQNGFRFIIPIRSKEKSVGAILVGERLSESPYNHEDLTFLTTIARQASVAIENAFLYENLAEQDRLKHELSIARRIQLESLPQSTPQIEGLDIAGQSVPAMEVGGDYFDYLNGTPDQLTVIVGDVSGKGTSAALYMSKVQGIIHSLNSFNLTPRQLFIRSNKILCADLEKKSFVTSIGALFNYSKHTVTLARAGHLPMYHYSARERRVMAITPNGVGLGITESFVFDENLEERELRYDTGDVFLFITDGVTEAQNEEKDEFSEERVIQILHENAKNSSQEILNNMISAVNSFTGSAMQHDDETVVVIKAV